MAQYRIEKDTLGEVQVPEGAYWGAQTERARQLYQISGLSIQPEFIRAQLMIKEAAAVANKKTKALPANVADAIAKVCREIRNDFEKWKGQFVVDIYQAGAGTSQNMNANEGIARRATELLKGKAKVHPNDHVNRSQSTNDTIPSAMYIAAFLAIQNGLLPNVKQLESVLLATARQFKGIKKTGRTHLQDAVPMALGDEFSAWAHALTFHRKNIETTAKGLLEINLGGTAIGSGINATREYRQSVMAELKKITRYPFKNNPDLFMGTQNVDAILAVSGALRNTASVLIKIAEDIRILASGPTSGIAELKLKPVQPGSSIMPGKVNPSVAEMLIMVCLQAIGMDQTVGECYRKSQLELNVTMPLVAFNILHMIQILGNGSKVFAEKCVAGIQANEERCRYYLERNPIVATALTPRLGYEKVAELIKRSYAEGKTIREVVRESRLLTEREITQLLPFD